MDSFQEKKKDRDDANGHEERIQKINSEIKEKKQQLIEELENSSDDDSRRRRPKFSRSQIENPEPHIEGLEHQNESLGPHFQSLESHIENLELQTENLELHVENPEPLEFAPFLSETVFLKGRRSYDGTCFYNIKHNLIIAFPAGFPPQFFDATTLLPIEERNSLEFDGNVVNVSFCPETDTFLFTSTDNSLIAYDFSQKVLKALHKDQVYQPSAVTFINSSYYAFSGHFSPQRYVGNFEDDELLSFGSEDEGTCFVQKMEQKNRLVLALDSGLVEIYRTDRLPRLQTVCSFQAYKEGGTITNVDEIMIGKRRFIITSRMDFGDIKIWQLVRGKVKLLRVIKTEQTIRSCIYLENYRMIATIHDGYIQFFSLLTGEFKGTFDLPEPHLTKVFLMKDKNSLGVADWSQNVINIIQLHPQDN